MRLPNRTGHLNNHLRVPHHSVYRHHRTQHIDKETHPLLYLELFGGGHSGNNQFHPHGEISINAFINSFTTYLYDLRN
jgi:hypothetical protein